MAGGILVKGPIDLVPEIAKARDELMVLQLVKLNPDLDRTEPLELGAEGLCAAYESALEPGRFHL